MSNINAPVGERDGFPWPILASWFGGAPCDALTHHNLARACVALGMRRRLVVPICGYRYLGSAANGTTAVYPFAFRREMFARTARLTGFYVLLAGGDARLKLDAGITTPSLAVRTVTMPPSVDASGTEFAMDIDIGDGSEGTIGHVRGYFGLAVVDEASPTSNPGLVVLYGVQLELLPVMQGEVTTT